MYVANHQVKWTNWFVCFDFKWGNWLRGKLKLGKLEYDMCGMGF